MVYRRSFEKNIPVHAHLQLNLDSTISVLEINDPTPKELKSSNYAVANGSNDPFAELHLKSLPAFWDWRTSGIVPSVRDQGACGSCWAFGTVSVMESAVRKGGGPLVDLSEQFLINCNNDGWDCDGGLTASMYHTNTLGKSQNAAGAVLESIKPYTATNGSCAVALPHAYKSSSWQFIVADEFTMPTVDQIKTAIYTYGPVTAGVCAGSGWDSYTGGVFATDETSQCGGQTNHQIVLVGWNNNTQSWILRNTWGTAWGINGYMNIKWNTSRVGEGTSWIRYVGTNPTGLTAYRPAGDTYAVKPTYSWSKMGTTASYKLRVKDVATGTYPINGVTISSSYCNVTTNRCSYPSSTALIANKGYQWQVAAGNGIYTSLMAFKILPGINSQFNGSSTGWVNRPGATWVNNSVSYYTNGLNNLISSASYNKNFGNFTYQARMKRVGNSINSSGLVVRGLPVFGSDNDWNTSYQFLYSQDGYFSVWKGLSGSWTTLKGWTTSAAIVDNGWNVLKVTADGSQFRFYINNSLVWSGTDSALTTGQVGILMDRGTVAEKLEVDWATLGMSELYKASANTGNVEANQIELINTRDRFGNPVK